MVKRIPQALTPVDLEACETQSPEDASMSKNGVFHEDNTHPPSQTQVLPLFNLKHKTAIVSGSGAGIGLAVVHAFAEAGANVVIWYHSNRDAIDRASEIEARYGVKCRAYQVDVTAPCAVDAAVAQAVADFNGRLDIFVANAGIPWTHGRMIDGAVADYRKVVATDLDGVYYCAQAAGRVFRTQYQAGGRDAQGDAMRNYRYGSFIATASMSGHIANIPQLQSAVCITVPYLGHPTLTDAALQYNAAKAGVIQLCKSLAVEWVRFARVNSVSPGYMATEISDFIPPETKKIWHGKIPMGREGQVPELKGPYLFLASDASSYMTGADLVVDGGYTAV